MASPLNWFVRPFTSFLPGTAVRNAQPDPGQKLRDRRELVVSIVEKELQNGRDPEAVLQALTQTLPTAPGTDVPPPRMAAQAPGSKVPALP